MRKADEVAVECAARRHRGCSHGQCGRREAIVLRPDNSRDLDALRSRQVRTPPGDHLGFIQVRSPKNARTDDRLSLLRISVHRVFYADDDTSSVCRHREQHHIHRVEPGPRHLARTGFAHCVAAAERHSILQIRRMLTTNRYARGTGLDLSALAVGLRAERHPAGTVLFARGDKGDAAFLVARVRSRLPSSQEARRGPALR